MLLTDTVSGQTVEALIHVIAKCEGCNDEILQFFTAQHISPFLGSEGPEITLDSSFCTDCSAEVEDNDDEDDDVDFEYEVGDYGHFTGPTEVD